MLETNPAVCARRVPPAMSRRNRWKVSGAFCLLWALALTRAPGVPAQSPADRAALAAYRSRLALMDPGDLARETRDAGSLDSPIERLRYAYAALYLGRAEPDQQMVNQALTRFVRLTSEQRGWPEVWLGLGLARLAAYQQGVIAKAGPLQYEGMTYAGGAARALVHALTLDPSLLEAARTLSSIPAPDLSRGDREAIVAALVHATSGPAPDPEILLGRAGWESAEELTDSAIQTLHRYLEAKGDPALGLYHLARQLFRSGASEDAVSAYFRGARSPPSEPATALYRQDIAWVASPAELAEFDSLTSDQRGEWIYRFWARRDVIAGRPAGARITEHYRRYEYALVHYGIDRANTTRPLQSTGSEGGPATSVTPEDRPSADKPNAPQAPTSDGAWERLLVSSAFREYTPTQSLVDDRGVIYIRHGPPDRIALYVGGEKTPANLSWLYYRPAGNLVFHFLEADFDASTGPTVLALLPPYMFESRCGIDPPLCLLAARRGYSRLSRLARERTRVREAIREGTTTDGYHRRFERELGALIQVYGEFGPRPSDAAGRLLTATAIPADGLIPAPGDSAGQIGYRVRFQIMALGRQSGQRFDLDTVRTFRADHELRRGEYLSALTEMAVPPDSYLVSVLLSQEGDQRGSGTRFDPVSVPSATATTLALSDIILGRAGSGLTWQSGRGAVPINPLNAFAHGTSVTLFSAAAGMEPGASYDVRLTLTRQDTPGDPILSLRFEETAEATMQVFQRSVDISRLRRGGYILHVILRHQGTGAEAERSVFLNVVER